MSPWNLRTCLVSWIWKLRFQSFFWFLLPLHFLLFRFRIFFFLIQASFETTLQKQGFFFPFRNFKKREKKAVLYFILMFLNYVYVCYNRHKKHAKLVVHLVGRLGPAILFSYYGSNKRLRDTPYRGFVQWVLVRCHRERIHLILRSPCLGVFGTWRSLSLPCCIRWGKEFRPWRVIDGFKASFHYLEKHDDTYWLH